MHKYNTPARSIENYTPAGWRRFESCNRTAKDVSLLIRKSSISLFFCLLVCFVLNFIYAGSGDLYFCSLSLFHYLCPQEEAKVNPW